MDDVKLTCASLHECGTQEVSSQNDALLDLRNQITHLFCTRLNANSITVLQEKLRLMQRSSYYLEVQHDLPPTEEQQQTLNLSDSTVLSLIDHWRLEGALTLANTQVKLLLSLLGMLYEEIIRSCRELEVFIIKCNQGLLDSDMAVSMQEKLRQTHQYLDDFESRMTRNLGPLDLPNQLIMNTGQHPMAKLSASLAIKMPVVFDRCKSHVTSYTAHLFWEVATQQSEELGQEFEILIKSLHPTADQGEFIKTTCQSYCIQFSNLTPDSYYQFSVKRVDVLNLVYELWTDTIILKTTNVPK
ncbi:fibronectin type III domain-containing protein 11-like [Scomber scombrus]|uniref:Fibronectin type III domain-containing protein 11-like n=1 Tax=Scomber scombrus TaxID=13677 RepID=A0AAV1P2Z9_SCOSC